MAFATADVPASPCCGSSLTPNPHQNEMLWCGQCGGEYLACDRCGCAIVLDDEDDDFQCDSCADRLCQPCFFGPGYDEENEDWCSRCSGESRVLVRQPQVTDRNELPVESSDDALPQWLPSWCNPTWR